MEKYKYFAALAEKKRLGAEDKAAIKEEAEELGITFNEKCNNCYHDAAVQIALHYKPEQKEEERPAQVVERGEYELQDGIDITIDSYKFGRLHVCQANCTPANAQLWLRAGLPARFFKHMPR